MHCLWAILYSILFSLVGKMSTFLFHNYSHLASYPALELLKLPFSQLFMPFFFYIDIFILFNCVSVMIVFPIHCSSVYFSIYTLAHTHTHTTKLIDLWCAFDLFFLLSLFFSFYFYSLVFLLLYLALIIFRYSLPSTSCFVENWEILAVKQSTQPSSDGRQIEERKKKAKRIIFRMQKERTWFYS